MPEPTYKPVFTQLPEEARRTAAIPSMHQDLPHVQFSTAIARAGEEAGRAVGQLGSTMHTVAQAVGTLGTAFNHAGNEIWDRAVALKQLESEKKVNDATIGYEMGQLDRDEKFKLKEGTAADSAALKAHMEESNNARLAIKNTLTPYEQRMFDQQTTRQYIQSMRTAGSWAASQTRAAIAGSYEARLKMTTARMGNATEDADFEAGKAEATQIVKEMQAVHGWTDEKALQHLNENIEHAFATRAKFIAETDPTTAMKMLEANKGRMNPIIYMQAYNSVKGQLDKRGSRNIADDVFNENPDATLEDMRKRAAELADERHKGDITLKDLAVQRTESKWRDQKQDQDEIQKKNLSTALDIVYGFKTQSGKRPHTIEEAEAEPGFKAAFDGIKDPQHRKAIIDIINKREDFPWSPEAQAEFHKWDGLLRFEHKQETTAAIANNPGLINDLKIPYHMRDQLYNTWRANQAQMKKTEGELKVDHGVSVLRQKGYGEMLRKMQKPAKAVFYSVLSTLAEREEQRLKRPLKDEEWEAVGNQAFNTKEVEGWFGFKSHPEYYRTFAPGYSKEYNIFKDRFTIKNQGANPAAIQRAFNDWKIQRDLEADEARKK